MADSIRGDADAGIAVSHLEKGGIPVQEHVARAAKLIDETGYKRRLPELAALQKRICAKPFG